VEPQVAGRAQDVQEHLVLGELARRTGYAPSLTVLDRLAQLYGCDVTDLLTGWGEHDTATRSPVPTPNPPGRSGTTSAP